MRRRPGTLCPLWGGLLFLCGCASTGDRSPEVPQFTTVAQVPICIRVEDRRPDLETQIDLHRGEWIYLLQDPEAQAADLSRLVGNALNAFGATPGYRIVKPETPVDMWEYLVHLTYVEGYARWPVEVDRRATTVAVEGACEFDYTLYRRGKKVHSGRVKAHPPPFRLPLNMIRADNVEKMAAESLRHQYSLARRNALDSLMMELAEEWPDYVKRK